MLSALRVGPTDRPRLIPLRTRKVRGFRGVSTKPSFAIYARCAPPPTPGLDLDAETVVFSNGNGFQPHTVDELLYLLQTEKLTWSEVEDCADGIAVTGNFEHFSHVFNIYTRDQKLASALVSGIQKATCPCPRSPPRPT